MTKLLKYLKPYLLASILAPLLMMIEVLSDILQPKLMATIVDKGIYNGDISLILHTGGIMIGLALIGVVGGIGCTATASYASMKFGADVRSDVYKKIQKFSFSNLDEFKTASLITRLTNDIVQVQNIVLMMLRMLVRSPLLCIGGLIMAISLNAHLALIFVVVIPLLVISLLFIINKGFPLFNIVQTKLDKVNAVIRENLTGVRVVKAFVRSDLEKDRFDTANNDLTNINTTASRLMTLTMPIMMLLMNLSVVAVIWFGGIEVDKGTLKVGEIMAFINYMTQILSSLLMLTMGLMNFSRAKVSADRVNEVLETDIDIEDAKAASDEPIENGSVVFENVSFKYKGASGDPVLKNISFKANPGETVAILGGTGSGKSSLVNLIPRLYDVTGGRILIDGRDIRSIKINTLRKGISFVLQESILFSGSIKENICFGKKNATEAEILEAAKAADAHDFISGFADGYETTLGQRGVNVSGGQKQRLSIARALIKKPPILILDDSTSAVDMGTESRIQKALKEMMKNTTCIIIAQRISTVLDADKILVLEDGEIAAEGNHEELLKTSPVYRDICISQLGEEVLKNA